MSLEKSCTASSLRSPEMTTCSWSAIASRSGLHRGLHQLGDLAAQLVDLALQSLAHFLDREAGVVGGEEVARLDQLRLRVVLRGEDDAVLHVAVRRDHDDEDASFAQPQELDVAEHARLARRGDHADEVRQVRQQLRRVA